MKYIKALHNRIIRQYARNRGYYVTDRGNHVLYKCDTLEQAEAFIEANKEGMSIPHGAWQEELWSLLKAGITVTPMQHGAAHNTTNPVGYRSSWQGMCKRIEIAGYQLEQIGVGDQAQYRLVKCSAAN